MQRSRRPVTARRSARGVRADLRATVIITLEIECDVADVADRAVSKILDIGTLQDAINEYPVDGDALLVVSATSEIVD